MSSISRSRLAKKEWSSIWKHHITQEFESSENRLRNIFRPCLLRNGAKHSFSKRKPFLWFRFLKRVFTHFIAADLLLCNARFARMTITERYSKAFKVKNAGNKRYSYQHCIDDDINSRLAHWLSMRPNKMTKASWGSAKGACFWLATRKCIKLYYALC